MQRYEMVHKPYMGDSLERSPDGEWCSYDDVRAVLDRIAQIASSGGSLLERMNHIYGIAREGSTGG